MRTRFLQLCIFVCVAIGLCSRAAAQSADVGGSESAAYREAISSALDEFNLGNYAEAREQFRVAHELSPSARTLRGLGITEFELRNYPESVRLLE